MTSPADIQKELEQIIREKFGSRLNILSTTITPVDSDDQEHVSTKDTPPQEDKDDFYLTAFHKTPKELKQYLDQFVISQDEAKKSLAIAICNHYNHIFFHHHLDEEDKEDMVYAKQNVLLIGPTGVGKTYMIRQIAKLIDVPFVRADATKYSETGYVGGNVEDLIRDLAQQAGDNINRAQYGIVYIDEADKLATASGMSHDISGRGVQLNLLKLLEETEVDLKGGHDPVSQIQTIMEMHATGGKPSQKIISTKHILFILSGSFNGLAEIIAKRKSLNTIGFALNGSPSGITEQKNDHFADLATEDLITFGFEPEFVGRLPVRVACHHLSVEDLFQILKTAEGNIIRQYQQAFAAYRIKAQFTDCAYREIAKKAHRENTGARSLSTILDQSLKDFLYELPSLQIDSLVIDGELIKDPKKVLASTIKDLPPKHKPKASAKPKSKKKSAKKQPGPDQKTDQLKSALAEYSTYFHDKHGIKVTFDPYCMEYLGNHIEESDDFCEFLKYYLSKHETTIKLIAHLRDEDSIELDEISILRPKKTLQNWIQEAIAKREKQKFKSSADQEINSETKHQEPSPSVDSSDSQKDSKITSQTDPHPPTSDHLKADATSNTDGDGDDDTAQNKDNPK